VEAEKFLEQLKQTAVGQQLLNRQAAEMRERRQALADEIAALQEDRTRTLPPLRKAVDKATAELQSAQAVLDEAKNAARAATGQHEHAKAAFSARRRRLENLLRAIAPPAIARFVERLQDETTALCARRVQTGAQRTNRLNAAGGLVREHYSDGPSIARRLEAIRQAIDAAELMKLEVTGDAELDARLEKLYTALPDVAAERLAG